MPSNKKSKLKSRLKRIHKLLGGRVQAKLFAAAYGSAIFSQQFLNNPKSQKIKSELAKLHGADIADLLESSPLEHSLYLYHLLALEQQAYVLIEVNPSLRRPLVNSLSQAQLIDIAKHLDSDKLADITPLLSMELVDKIIAALDAHTRQEFAAATQYGEHQVGAVMDFEQIKVRPNVSLKVVSRYLQRFASLPAKTDQIFVVDDFNSLVGILPLRTLVANHPKTLVKDVMQSDFHSFLAAENVEDVAGAFERYDLVTAAVVDEHQRIIGRLTINEMVDVMRAASEEDAYIMAGFSNVQATFSPVLDAFKSRWLWLVINLGTAFFASRVIGMFEDSIEKIVALAALMPIVAGIGGNAGNQTITMIVRSMVQHSFSWKQIRTLWLNEALVALLNGVIWGSLLGAITWWLYDYAQLGLVMVLAMSLNLLLAASMGVLIPYLMQRSGRDPALGSSVLITACTDSGGFFIFLGLANLILL